MKQRILNRSRFWMPVLLFLMSPALWAASSMAQATMGAGAASRVQAAREFQTKHLPLLPAFRAAASTVAVLDERRTSEFDGDGWMPSERTVFGYSGLVRTTELNFQWNGEAYFVVSRTLYKTVAPGSVPELTEEWDEFAGGFVPRERIDYTIVYELFSGRPAVKRALRTEWNGAEWVDQDVMVFEFNEQFEVVSGQTSMWSGDQWIPVDRYELEEQGGDVIQTSQMWDGAGWINSERVVFFNHTVASLNEAMASLVGKVDDYGPLFLWLRVPDHVAQEWDGSQWIDLQKQQSEHWYDVFTGRIMRSDITINEWTGDSWEEVHRQVINFEDGRRAESSTIMMAGEAGWHEFLTESYVYDHLGDMMSATQAIDFFGTGMTPFAKHQYVWSHPTVGVEDGETPHGFALEAAYPNPFNPTTNVTYQLGSSGQVAIRVYDALGRHVSTLFDGHQPAGRHTVRFEAADLSSGVYLVRLDAPGFKQTRTVTLAK